MRKLFNLLPSAPPQDATSWSPTRIHAALRARRGLADLAFDQHLPHDLRVPSGRFWTPLVVVRVVSDWIAYSRIASLLDVGSGAGKLCVAAALATDAQLVGIERRGHLVVAAQALAEKFDVTTRVRFIEGSLGSVALPPVDAYYFYNPFEEHAYHPNDRLDDSVELGPARAAADVAAAEALLTAAPVGTVAITYNGLGGRIPGSYDIVHVDRSLPNVLRIWKRMRAATVGTYHLDIGDDSESGE